MKSLVVSRKDESAGAQVVVWAWRLLCGLGIIALSLLCLVCLLPVALVVDMVREAPTKLAQFRQDGYAARVERVAPAVPGLIVESFPSVEGAIRIRNETGQVVYIGPAGMPADSERGWVAIPPGQDVLVAKGVEYGGYRDNLPMGQQPGQVMKTWIIPGRAGDTTFSISGITVYDPLPPQSTPVHSEASLPAGVCYAQLVHMVLSWRNEEQITHGRACGSARSVLGPPAEKMAARS